MDRRVKHSSLLVLSLDRRLPLFPVAIARNDWESVVVLVVPEVDELLDVVSSVDF